MRELLAEFSTRGTYVRVLVGGEWYGGTIEYVARSRKLDVFVLRNYRKDIPAKIVSMAHVAMVQESSPDEEW